VVGARASLLDLVSPLFHHRFTLVSHVGINIYFYAGRDFFSHVREGLQRVILLLFLAALSATAARAARNGENILVPPGTPFRYVSHLDSALW